VGLLEALDEPSGFVIVVGQRRQPVMILPS
jgi:hypothetical protein